MNRYSYVMVVHMFGLCVAAVAVVSCDGFVET